MFPAIRGTPPRSPNCSQPRLIKMYSFGAAAEADFPGDVVLDPFGGYGTTALAAKTLGRQYISIDISEEFTTPGTAQCCPAYGKSCLRHQVAQAFGCRPQSTHSAASRGSPIALPRILTQYAKTRFNPDTGYWYFTKAKALRPSSVSAIVDYHRQLKAIAIDSAKPWDHDTQNAFSHAVAGRPATDAWARELKVFLWCPWHGVGGEQQTCNTHRSGPQTPQHR